VQVQINNVLDKSRTHSVDSDPLEYLLSGYRPSTTVTCITRDPLRPQISRIAPTRTVDRSYDMNETLEQRIDLSTLGFEITIPAAATCDNACDDFFGCHDNHEVNDDDSGTALDGREEAVDYQDDAASLRLPTNQPRAQSDKENPSPGKQIRIVSVVRAFEMSELGLEDATCEDPSPALLGYEDASVRDSHLPSPAQLGYDDASLQAGLSMGKPIRNLRSSLRRSQHSAMSGLRSSCSSSGVTSHSSYWKEEEEWESLRHKHHHHHHHHHHERHVYQHHRLRRLSALSQRSSPLLAIERPVKGLFANNTPTGGRFSLPYQRPLSLQDQPYQIRRQSYCEGLVRAATSHDHVFGSLRDLVAADFIDNRRIERMPGPVALENDDDRSSNSSIIHRRVSVQFSVASGGGNSAASYGSKSNSRAPRKVSLAFHQPCASVDEDNEGVALPVIERRGSLDYSVRTSCLPRRSSSTPLALALHGSRRASLGSVYLGPSATNQRGGFRRLGSFSSSNHLKQNQKPRPIHGDEDAI
jgi:hypothetical protein